jgi:hypothetical protein
MNNREIILMLYYSSKRVQSELASFVPSLKDSSDENTYKQLSLAIAESIDVIEQEISKKIGQMFPDVERHYQERLEIARLRNS